ncbi:hypothetical protein D4765_00290 [Subtercola vilae]|uniref:DUF308 domain-containing protein n=1 Tax=Subtercola vilae TaxID=2056433 RepID=A0A4T2CEC1_9MICO|nr:hypothetical protein D4765_00290 [Subtercola vilae]
MSIQQNRTQGRSPYWGVPVARAIPAFVVAAYLTFTENHSSQVSLFVFGSYAVVSGLFVAGLSARFVVERLTRRLFVLQGLIGVVLGAAALVFNTGGVPLFLYLVSLFGALTGFIELYSGLRSRNSAVVEQRLLAKDWLAAGVFTALLALVFLVIPLDVVTAIGLFGGYAVMLGLYLVIGGLSLRWGPQPTRHVSGTAPRTTESLNQETTS